MDEWERKRENQREVGVEGLAAFAGNVDGLVRGCVTEAVPIPIFIRAFRSGAWHILAYDWR